MDHDFFNRGFIFLLLLFGSLLMVIGALGNYDHGFELGLGLFSGGMIIDLIERFLVLKK
jgi:hypothetical protein